MLTKIFRVKNKYTKTYLKSSKGSNYWKSKSHALKAIETRCLRGLHKEDFKNYDIIEYKVTETEVCVTNAQDEIDLREKKKEEERKIIQERMRAMEQQQRKELYEELKREFE